MESFASLSEQPEAGRLLAAALAEGPAQLAKVDAFLARTSWDRTALAMADLADAAASRRIAAP